MSRLKRDELLHHATILFAALSDGEEQMTVGLSEELPGSINEFIEIFDSIELAKNNMMDNLAMSAFDSFGENRDANLLMDGIDKLASLMLRIGIQYGYALGTGAIE